ncbi:MAG: hypothetical protein IPK87_00440 [Planctomycetes bacterium]|nr:hypothetical protein [Planctomycetota bacterium]
MAYTELWLKAGEGMESMGYLILVALVALPLCVMGLFLVLMITGVFSEPEGAEGAAMGYRLSWKGHELWPG